MKDPVERWVEQKYGDLFEIESPIYRPPWKTWIIGILLILVWATIILGLIFGG